MNRVQKFLSGIGLFALSVSGALAAELTVGCGYDYATIQAAVNAAAPWDTITVCPGIYDEDVLITGNRDGLTIQSTEVAALGPNTEVQAFSIGFAPSGGPEYVTIKGFRIGDAVGCASGNGVGIESSGNFNTIAHNYVTGCAGDAAIRVNIGNIGNTVHHNTVEETYRTGIKVEAGENHNVHNNLIDGAGWKCLHVSGGDYGLVHQNLIANCNEEGIRLESDADYNQVHQNAVCDSISMSSSADFNFVHHNFANSLTGCGGNKCKFNTEEAGCPF